MFITEKDYIQVGPEALKIMQQNSEENRRVAENRALSRIASALRGRYDVDTAFAMEGEKRDAEMVGCAVDIALYHMACSLPQRMGGEVREKRYNAALDYLKEIQAGRVTPSIPTLTGEDGEEDCHNPVRYGSAKRNEYMW